MLADKLGNPGGLVYGLTTYFVATLPALKRAGIELSVCFIGVHHPAAEKLEANGVVPIFLRRHKWDPRAFLDLIKLFRERDFQLVHLTGRKSMLLGGLAARLFGLPAIIHLHDLDPPEHGTRLAQRALARRSALAIAVSESVRDVVQHEFAIPAERIVVLYNGLDLRPFAQTPAGARAAIRAELALSDTAPVIAVIGRVLAFKGQAELIRAMPYVLEQHPGAKLLVVGEGSDRARCERLARQLGITEAVVFMGQRLDTPQILAAVDAVAVPSLVEEGFGLTALEAIAAGKPVVAFRSGALPIMVIHEETGLLVASGDVTGLAQALVRILSDKALAARLAAGARAHSRRFTLNRHVRKLRRIYARCAAQG
jgi:glycosyltransferase involved in cell wall biosynthesis